MLYLDNSATSYKKPVCVYESLFFNTLFNSANAGRGDHKLSMSALKSVMDTQESAAKLFNADNPMNIAFTLNATYALNMVILGTICPDDHIVVTQMDHNSILRPVFGCGSYSIVRADKSGYVKAEDVEKAIRKNTKMIAITHASNVCGTVEPVKEIGEIAKKNGILFLVDAAQTAGCKKIDVKEINADFLAFSGHKGLMGPLGTGGLYVKNPDTLKPLIKGGTGSQSESMIQPRIMPDMLHSGTVNTPAIAALGDAIRYVMHNGVETIGAHQTYLANRLADNLRNMNNVTVYGRSDRTGAVAFNINGVGSEETAHNFKDKAVVRAGYHCAPMAHTALGTDKTGAVRASFGFFNKKKDVEKFTDIVWEVSKKYKG